MKGDQFRNKKLFQINCMIKWTVPRLRIPGGPAFTFRSEDLVHLLKDFCCIRYFLKANSSITPQIIPGCFLPHPSQLIIHQ